VLDEAVFGAYGLESTVSNDKLLAQLLALNLAPGTSVPST